eukprot:TRINITY_DN15768_c0_g1_i1.p1 TRINITY_DN15768_c0_g1~~TRINITY_DN15768_c0_g1_i1.p1  ORF type:complete len:392 (+),score=38.86 TRINITY_DN15768_c0_g1_i1:60-1235(+)
MGYCTGLKGSIKIKPPLPQKLADMVNSLVHPYTGRNNNDGDGDPYSFDGVIHHLTGLPKGIKHGEVSAKDGVSKAPSFYCQWILVNKKNEETGVETFIKWDKIDKFYEFMYWMQYFVDFVTLYAKHEFGIVIQQFDGIIKWTGDNLEEHGRIQIKNRKTAEVTGFYPDDFLPLPPPSEQEAQNSAKRCYKTHLEMPTHPKGAVFMSVFGVEVTVKLKASLKIGTLYNVERDGGVSRGGYVLLLKESPNKALNEKLTFYIHHERSDVVHHPDDPVFKCMTDDYNRRHRDEKAVAITKNVEIKSLKCLAADAMEKLGAGKEVGVELKAYVDELTAACRRCTDCGRRLEGPAYLLAVWRWPYGYSSSFLGIYCSGGCFKEPYGDAVKKHKVSDS